MIECLIFFAYHADDAVTREHLRLLQIHNPRYLVMPVSNGHPATLANSISICNDQPWREGDQVIYQGFRRRPFEAKRYAYLEWDCRCTLPLSRYYGDAWDADVAAVNLPTGGWPWFREIQLLPPRLRPHAAGLMPLNGVLLSHRALQEISSAAIPARVFSELRLGTLVAAAGFKPVELPQHRLTNTWHPSLLRGDPRVAGIYHPVKVKPVGNFHCATATGTGDNTRRRLSPHADNA